MRVFKTKPFARWCALSDELLCKAAREIAAGQYEADLGKGVIKKRIAYPGQGKSSSARVLIATRVRDSLVFLAGRDKSDPGKDFTDANIAAVKELAVVFEKLAAAQIDAIVKSGGWKEICNGTPKDP